MSDELQRLWTRVLDRAESPPSPDAVPLVVGGQVCGSTDGLIATSVAAAVPGFYLRKGSLHLEDDGLAIDERSLLLDSAARWLLQVGFVSPWRDETLDVRADGEGPVLARVDRCAVRALGITTHSVRLNGYAGDGLLFAARRAAHKRVDPGLWDNLAGGMMGAGETLRSALVRETYEEAGLQIAADAPREGGRVRVRRQIADGVLCEIVHAFDLDFEPGTQPVNRDGEVDCFEVRTIPTVLQAIERGQYTIEASLAILDSMLRRDAERN